MTRQVKTKAVAAGEGVVIDDTRVHALANTRYYYADDAAEDSVVYLADFTDSALKDVVGHMEFPTYAMATTEPMHEITYTYKDIHVELTSGKYGLPTMNDKGVMIYIISQFMRIKKEGGQPGYYLRLKVNDTLKFCKRSTCGEGYKSLMRALDRLTSTYVKTNIPAARKGGSTSTEVRRFHVLERADSVHHFNDEDRRLDYVEVKISDWLYDAIKDNNVLTLSPRYFDLTPNERRVYELARKHVGTKRTFSLKYETLFQKSGTNTTKGRYKYHIKKMAQSDSLPDYHMQFEQRIDKKTGAKIEHIVFTNRNTVPGSESEDDPAFTSLHPETVEVIKETFKGLTTDDIYMLAGLFANEQARSKKKLYNFESQFMGFLISKGPKELKKLKDT